MIRVHAEDGLWLVRLDRPDKANALTERMLRDLVDAARSAADANAFLLTGTGAVFSAGADLEAARAGLATSPLWEDLSGAIAALPGLTVCAANGTVAGGAMGMALACDLRVAAPGAKFFYPVMRLGFLPQPSDPGRLAALVGPARAKMILMAGQKVTTEEALAWGLVDRIADDPVAEARALAGDALGADPAHVAAIKRMVAVTAGQGGAAPAR